MWREHLWINGVEFAVGIGVCVCVKMVGHKRKTLLPLGNKPLYLGIAMAWGLVKKNRERNGGGSLHMHAFDKL